MEALKKRYSVRGYLDKQVEKDKVNYILEAARLAPSAINAQPWKFLVLQNKENLDKACSVYSRDWIKTAPLIIVALGEKKKSWKRNDGKDFLHIDVAIAVDHMTIAATEKGLGTCWIGAFDEKKLKKLFNIGEDLEAIVMLSVGYPKKNIDINKLHKDRKSIDEIIYTEHLK